MFKFFKILNLSKPIIRNFCQELTLECVFQKCSITPCIIPKAPCEELCMVFGDSSEKVDMGEELTPAEVMQPPKVTWEADNNDFHVLCMFDPDAPSRSNPIYRNWLHWLVGNIPGINIHKGCAIAEYVGSAPPKGTGIHRYIVLIYRQEGSLDFKEKCIPDTCAKDRNNFDVGKFVEKYKLIGPIAGNVFHAKFDCSVLKTEKKLGIS